MLYHHACSESTEFFFLPEAKRTQGDNIEYRNFTCLSTHVPLGKGVNCPTAAAGFETDMITSSLRDVNRCPMLKFVVLQTRAAKDFGPLRPKNTMFGTEESTGCKYLEVNVPGRGNS